MKKVIIAMICIISAIALALVVFLGIGLAGGPNIFSFFNIKNTAKLANRQTFSISDVNSIELDYRSLTLNILPSENGEVVLEEYLTSWDENMLALTSKNNGALRIQQGQTRITFGFWHGYVNLYLPASFAGDVDLVTSSGSIHCEYDISLQNLQAESSSGSVRFENIETAGDVSLKASSGNVSSASVTAGGKAEFYSSSGSIRHGLVHAKSIQAEANSGGVSFDSAIADTITAKSSSGSVRIQQLAGEFTLHSQSGTVSVEDGSGFGEVTSSSGSVRLTLNEVTGDITATSNSGSVRLYIPEDLQFNFEANTNSGSIHTPFDDDLTYNKKGNEASGSRGASPKHNIQLKASSGSVHVDWS